MDLPTDFTTLTISELACVMIDSTHDPGPEQDSSTPGLIVSVVLFRLQSGELHVNLATDTTSKLPSDAPRPDESLDAAAHRIVRTLLRANEEYMEQLYTFSPANAPQRSVVVSYLALQQPSDSDSSRNDDGWKSVSDISFDDGSDQAVLDYALIRLRAKLGYTNIAFHLVPEKFTLPELQRAYESILLHAVDKRNFRRRILASGILTQTNEKRRDGSHRPAALYRFASQEDHTSYLTPSRSVADGPKDQESGT
jgi:8-oxo-dGTP diphosphatase